MKLRPHARKDVLRHHHERVGTVMGPGRSTASLLVLWDGRKLRETYLASSLEKVEGHQAEHTPYHPALSEVCFELSEQIRIIKQSHQESDGKVRNPEVNRCLARLRAALRIVRDSGSPKR